MKDSSQISVSDDSQIQISQLKLIIPAQRFVFTTKIRRSPQIVGRIFMGGLL
jgi:hypothetical protein